MFRADYSLQFPVRVELPNPLFARALQQAIGGAEGKIRIAMQYMFQAVGLPSDSKYRTLLMDVAAEEFNHIEMLATAVAMNLKGAPLSMQEAAARDQIGGAVLNGMYIRHIQSTLTVALPNDSNGHPFSASQVSVSGNIRANMLANVTAEATGRKLAVRLRNMTNDPGMKEMLDFLFARDTLHQKQFMSVIEELDELEQEMPVPDTCSRGFEKHETGFDLVGNPGSGDEPVTDRRPENPSIRAAITKTDTFSCGTRGSLGTSAPRVAPGLNGSETTQCEGAHREAAIIQFATPA